MYVGVRAGGGIGDEIEDPAGDEYELYRVVFDITFFFFVIVILLAIIQGNFVLFVDAYSTTVSRHRALQFHCRLYTNGCKHKSKQKMAFTASFNTEKCSI